jgi:PBSX family phage portal protein
MGANAYHGIILHFKKNMLVKWFEPTRLLSKKDMLPLALNYCVLGNGYLQKLDNAFGRTNKLQNLAGLPMRRSKQSDHYLKLNADGSTVEFKHGEVLQLKAPDLKQDIYGMPEYLGGIQSVLLSEESTLFRRKYYINGAHMGYILVTNDAGLDDDTAKAIEAQVKGSKGPGNFRSLYMNIGRSQSKEPVQIIPVGDIGTKDEFERIKNITEREMLAMHRMPPGLSGIIPQNTGGFGDIEKTMHVYYELEVLPLQAQFLELNEVMGEEVVKFKKPEWLA